MSFIVTPKWQRSNSLSKFLSSIYAHHTINSLPFWDPQLFNMLKKLLFSSFSSRRFILHHKHTPSNNSESFPFYWPLSVVSCRPIKFSRALAMADGGSSETASSKAHKHTNRLAAEHSPYLLQHAHNPVISPPNFVKFMKNRFFLSGLLTCDGFIEFW